jgi:hypothetical protein
MYAIVFRLTLNKHTRVDTMRRMYRTNAKSLATVGTYITFPLLCIYIMTKLRRHCVYYVFIYILFTICIISNISNSDGVLTIRRGHTENCYYHAFYSLHTQYGHIRRF